MEMEDLVWVYDAKETWVPIQRITLAQTEDKKEKGIVLSVMNDGNQGNQVINARFQDCIFFRVCNNPKHNLRVHIEKLMEDEARIELVEQDSKNAKLEITAFML